MDLAPEELLAGMEQQGQRIRTLEMTIRYETITSGRAVALRTHYMQRPPGVASRDDWEPATVPPAEVRIRQSVALLDREYLGRFEEDISTYSQPDWEAGRDAQSHFRLISLWDGEEAFRYDEPAEGPPFRARVTAREPSSHTPQYSHPWNSHHRNVMDRLRDAIERDVVRSVERTEEGTYIVRCEFPNDVEFVIELAPSMGYAALSQSSYHGGDLRSRYRARFEEFADGIWLPVRGDSENYQEGELARSGSFEVLDVKVNEPSFEERVMDVDLPEGTRIIDYMADEMYQLSRDVNLGDGGPFGSVPIGQLVSRAADAVDARENVSEIPEPHPPDHLAADVVRRTEPDGVLTPWPLVALALLLLALVAGVALLCAKRLRPHG